MVQGETVRLRALEEADLEPALRWVNDPEVARLVNRVLPVSMPQHREWYRRIQEDRSQVVFAIETRQDRAYLGNCGLRDVDARVRKAELWIYLGAQEARGRGYGRDAVRCLVGYGFRGLNLHRIYLYVAEYNQAAYRLYAKFGFRDEGRLRDDIFQDGRYWDSIRMAMLEEEFSDQPTPPAAASQAGENDHTGAHA